MTEPGASSLISRRAAAQHLGVAADRCERRAELVRRIRDETSQTVLGSLALLESRLDLRQHAVEREAEPADLCLRRGRLDSAAVIARRDVLRHHPHLLERRQADAD